MSWRYSKASSVKMTDSGIWIDYITAFSSKSLYPLWLDEAIKKALNCFRACGDKWTRTTDSRIFSPMLYQLSYITLL